MLTYFKKHKALPLKTQFHHFKVFKDALKRVPSMSTVFPTSSLAKDLQAVAKVMSVRQALGAKRQIFFVNYGGWDMHDNLVNGLNQRLPIISDAIKAFYDSTVELGIAENVTTFTISDIERTITSNWFRFGTCLGWKFNGHWRGWNWW